jgi:hypothetical protein
MKANTSWTTWLKLYAAWVLGIGVVLGASLLALDPYDSGHFALFGSKGVPQFGPRLAVASFGRKPEYNTAIIGNSTMQLLDPASIVGKDVHAVSLAVSATGPKEQLSVANWFLRHHPGDKTRALIFGVDGRWCEPNQSLTLTHPFPFWLYGSSTLKYAVNMMQYQTLESAVRKIKLLTGAVPAMRADGFNDYTLGRVWDRAGFLERVGAIEDEPEPEAVETQTYDFQSADLISDFLSKLPAEVQVIFVMPPHFHPETEGPAADQHQACRATFKAIMEGRANTDIIDFLGHRDLTSMEQDYFDRLHYGTRVAKVMAGAINRTLAEDDE